MIVSFEGMDGSGKTTIAKAVADKNKFNYEPLILKKALNINDAEYSNLIKLVRKSTYKKLPFMFYTIKCILDNSLFVDTITERTMLSTYYFEKNKIIESEWDYVMQRNVIPDITFLLYASPKVRYDRIFKRNKFDVDLQSCEALCDGYDDMIYFAKKYNIPYIGINTELYSENELIELCTTIINQYKEISDKDERELFVWELNNKIGIDDLYLKKGGKVYAKKI